MLTKESIEKVEREISSILEIKNPSELEVQNLKELHKSIVENSKGNSGLAHKCLDEIVKIKAKIGEVDINKAYEDLEAQLEALKKTKKGRVSFQQIQDLALSVRFCSHSLSVCPSQGSDGTCRSSKVLRGIMDRIFTELKSEKNC